MVDGYSVKKTRERLRIELIVEAREEAEKKILEEKIKRAKSLLDVLDIETIAEKFELTAEETEKLKPLK